MDGWIQEGLEGTTTNKKDTKRTFLEFKVRPVCRLICFLELMVPSENPHHQKPEDTKTKNRFKPIACLLACLPASLLANLLTHSQHDMIMLCFLSTKTIRNPQHSIKSNQTRRVLVFG
ncbi:hypothetical protein VTJ04DRAFT_2922 [Mycothermus thermophilus]|uniref:uncharacterized protein n=1 Tax=Humicola insolens TaxID=85995 RepID=UPI0037446F44